MPEKSAFDGSKASVRPTPASTGFSTRRVVNENFGRSRFVWDGDPTEARAPFTSCDVSLASKLASGPSGTKKSITIAPPLYGSSYTESPWIAPTPLPRPRLIVPDIVGTDTVLPSESVNERFAVFFGSKPVSQTPLKYTASTSTRAVELMRSPD